MPNNCFQALVLSGSVLGIFNDCYIILQLKIQKWTNQLPLIFIIHLQVSNVYFLPFKSNTTSHSSTSNINKSYLKTFNFSYFMIYALTLNNINSNLQCRDCECWQAIWRDSSENRSYGENINTMKRYHRLLITLYNLQLCYQLLKLKKIDKEKAIQIFLKRQHYTLVCSYLTSTVIYFRKCENTEGTQKRSYEKLRPKNIGKQSILSCHLHIAMLCKKLAYIPSFFFFFKMKNCHYPCDRLDLINQ